MRAAEDQAAGQADQFVDTGDQMGEEAFGDHRGRPLDRRPGGLQRRLINTR